MTELGNTTAQDVGILTGKEGYLKALEEPELWETEALCSLPDCDQEHWQRHGQWRYLEHQDLISNNRNWRRRRPAKEEREGMRYVVRPVELHHNILVGDPGSHFIDVGLRLPFEWNRKPARITVEELPAAPALSDYRPCSREEAEANPERSQMRFRGRNISGSISWDWSEWIPLTDEPCRGRPTLDYEFRTRARPADEPAAEAPGAIISWQRAQERVNAALPVECSLDSTNWHPANRVTHSCGPAYVYRIPLTEPAAQPEPVAESFGDAVSRIMKKLSDRSLRIGWTNVFCGEIIGLEQQLRNMTDARDKAVAELANERTKVQCLRLALNQDSVSADSAIGSMQNIKNRVNKALNETAGKEQS